MEETIKNLELRLEVTNQIYLESIQQSIELRILVKKLQAENAALSAQKIPPTPIES